MTLRSRFSRPTATRTPRHVVAVVALIIAASTLSACTSGEGASDSSQSTRDIQPAPPGGITPESDAAVDDAGARANSATNRDVIRTASVSLVSPDPGEATEQVAEIATDAGGRVDSRTDSPATPGTGASGTLTLRIPVDELDEALEKITAVGDLQYASTNATDVTEQVIDLDARIAALRASVDRLLALIGTATTTADLIDLEGALSERQAELDSLEAQRDSVGDAVMFATVTVEVVSPAVVVGTAPGDFWGGIVVGFTSLMTFLSGALVVLGVLVPWLMVAAILAAAVVLVFRGRAARRGTPGPAQPPSAEHTPDSGLFPPAAESARQPDAATPPRPAGEEQGPEAPAASSRPDIPD